MHAVHSYNTIHATMDPTNPHPHPPCHTHRQTDPLIGDLSTAWVGNELTMLKRKENEGMDFAAHNATLSWLDRLGTRRCDWVLRMMHVEMMMMRRKRKRRRIMREKVQEKAHTHTCSPTRVALHPHPHMLLFTHILNSLPPQ